MNYLEKIFNQSSFKNYYSGKVHIDVPLYESDSAYSQDNGRGHIYGLLKDDITFDMSTTWGTIVPQMPSLTEFSEIVGSQNIFSWVSAATAAWKSTDPFTFKLTFYLVTYTRDQDPPILDQVRMLAKLCAVDSTDQFATVQVHGGYKLNLTDSNGNQLNKVIDNNKVTKGVGSSLADMSRHQGLIKMHIGDYIHLNGLLVENVSITPSSVQVATGIPLYIQVDAAFRTYRPLTADDIDTFFRGWE